MILTNQIKAMSAVMLLGCFTGCGGVPAGPQVYPVTGVVLRDGTPLADANVEFLPQRGRPSAGTTDREGKFVLEYMRGSRGALPGPHKIRIVERFKGAMADSGTAISPVPPEPKSYELKTPAEVTTKKNSFVIDLTAGTASSSSS